jgi:hypothetical protein
VRRQAGDAAAGQRAVGRTESGEVWSCRDPRAVVVDGCWRTPLASCGGLGVGVESGAGEGTGVAKGARARRGA